MKLQTLSVIFVIILIPVIIITSYYIQLQSDTINLQTSYTTKLLDATKAAMEAFEINTVNLNSAFSETSDSKRRDTMASINTFTTSLANGLGVGGAGSEYISSYVPAMAYTLYEGYYIYTPAETRKTIKDENGVTVFFNAENEKIHVNGGVNLTEGDILYELANGATAEGTYNSKNFTTKMENAATEYKHVLKPFTSYSERLKNGTDDITVNYTLDNYIRIYGKVTIDGTEKFVSKSGYLIDTTRIVGGLKNGDTPKKINQLNIDGSNLTPEKLKENITYFNHLNTGKDLRDWKKGEYNYIYDVDKNKIYYDGDNDGIDDDKWFKVSATGERTNIEDLTTPVYKQLSVPMVRNHNETYARLYYELKEQKWYFIPGEDIDLSVTKTNSEVINEYLGDTIGIDEKDDYSAINYYVESYIFSKWVENNLSDFESTSTQIFQTDTERKIFNNLGNPENDESKFVDHKNKVIKSVLQSDLQQCITSYARNSQGYTYYLPELKETDWSKILNNVSIVAFFQGVPAGTKYYNNYAIATSTNNKEYVNPNELYFIADGDVYAHKEYCSSANDNRYVGYRNIDFIQKSFSDDGKQEFYMQHTNYLDYSCLVDLSKYVEDDSKITKKNYNEALARERYIAREMSLPEEVLPSYSVYLCAFDGTGAPLTTFPTINYTIENSKGKTEYTSTGGYSGEKLIALGKQENTYTYEIDATKSTKQPSSVTAVTGDISRTEDKLQNVPETTTYSDYKSDSKVTIKTQKTAQTFTINAASINSAGVQMFSEEELRIIDKQERTKSPANWTTSTVSRDFSMIYEGDAGVLVRINVDKNYNVENEDVHLYSIINNSSNITLATKIKGITGYVQLEFENEKAGKKYYSTEIFDIQGEGEHTFYYSINDESWHDSEWKVTVKSVGDSKLGTAYVEHYEIEDKDGLNAFSNLINEGKMKTYFKPGDANMTKAMEYFSGISLPIKNEGLYNNGTLVASDGIYRRRFLLTQDIDLGGETFTPIAITGKYFDGYFNGQGNAISNANIKCDSGYKYIGFFGELGYQSTVKNLTLKDITVNLESLSKEEHKKIEDCYNAGVLAGYTNNARNDYKDLIDSTISNVKIQNSTILGTSYVGGIVGQSYREIANSEVSNSEVQSLGNIVKGIKNYIYIGGITGYTRAPITNSKISGLGDKEIKLNGSWQTNFNKNRLGDSQSGENDMHMYIGGIVGFTTNNVENCDVSGYNVGCSNINPSTEDFTGNNAYVEYYVGGYVGKCQNGKISFDIGSDNKEINVTVRGGLIEKFRYQVFTNKIYDYNGNYKSYTGGLVGYNSGNTITKITNNGKVFSSGYNTGGIIGYNSGPEISNCINNATVTADLGNIGGIVGRSTNGKISSCKNFGTIYTTGPGNINRTRLDVCFAYWSVGGDNCTGIGGISGKFSGEVIEKCGNYADISGNLNVGGITGIADIVKINYCCNYAQIKATQYGRVGGICGVALGMEMNKCYNKGNISGSMFRASLTYKLDYWDGVWYGAGGLVGVGMSNLLTFSDEYINWDTGEWNLKIWKGIKHEAHPQTIAYCYNTGTVEGGYKARYHCGSIIGCEFAFDYDNDSSINGGEWVSPTYIKNYFLDSSAPYGIGKGISTKQTSENQGLNNQDLVTQLYRWATPGARNGGLASGSTYIYNTISPVEKDKGYNGYGVLFWELEGYYRQKFQIYDNKGPVIYDPARLNIDGKTVDIYLDKDLNDNLYSQNHTFNGTRFSALNGRTFKLHTYVLMLKQGSYKCKAEVSHYKDPEEKIVNVNSNDQTTLLYAGDRPEFIIAIRQEFGERTRTVPAGKYYVIASGGGGAGNAEEELLFKTKIGGGSGAVYRGLVELQEDKYTFKVGKAGKFKDLEAIPLSGEETYFKLGESKKIEVTGGERRRIKIKIWKSR